MRATHAPGFLEPHAYLELHVEQGPVLDRERVPIGAVENLQGISWQRVTIAGVANHAGTTPMSMRQDAGHAAARVVTFLRDRATASNTPTVATVGSMRFEPNAINVIPARATLHGRPARPRRAAPAGRGGGASPTISNGSRRPKG